jgi:hexokinase
MAAARYLDPATEIGIILGTGTNAGIVLQVQDIPKWQPEGIAPSTQTAINTEWGAYNGSQYLPNCKEDQELDKQSGAARGEMLLEKMVSGLYLGDITRRILATFAEKTQLLGKVVPPLIREQGSFTTAMLSKIESDVTPFRNTVARVVHDELGVPWKELTYARRLAIQKVCRMVVKRSARVFTAALMALLRQQKWLEAAAPKRVTIAVDGGVILKYANWRKYQKEALREALGDRSRELFHLIKLRPTPDGSGLGTAVLAAATMAEKGSSSAQ